VYHLALRIGTIWTVELTPEPLEFPKPIKSSFAILALLCATATGQDPATHKADATCTPDPRPAARSGWPGQFGNGKDSRP
jgi:hypothetical protein